MSVHYANIAESHRRLAVAADTAAERAHWESEAERFEELGSLSVSDPAAAYQMYRPTRAYQPAEPTVSVECVKGMCGNCWDDTCGCTQCGHPGA